MRRTNRSGVVDPVTLILIVVLGIGGATLAGWRPLDLFRKKPDTVQLTKLQADLAASQAAEAKARADALQLQKDKDSAILAERTKYNDQLRSAQQSNVGAEYILSKVPNPSPEIALGTAMVARTNLRFTVALGALPKEQQDDIVQIMDGIIAQRDDALAKLAETDKKFEALTGEHATTVKVLAEKTTELVVATQKVEVLAKETGVVQGQVTVATNQVKVIAKNLSDEKSTNSSLATAATRGLYVSAALVGGWLFLAYVLPGITGVMKSGALKNFLRNVSGFILNPIHHADAKATIDTLKATLAATPAAAPEVAVPTA